MARDLEHIFELGENGLGGFRAEVGLIIFALDRTDVSFEHEIERTRFGQQAAVFGIVAGRLEHLLGPFT